MGGSWGLCWRSSPALRPLLAVLGLSWGRCVLSWAALGAYVGGLGPLLGPTLAVLGRSWGSEAEKCEERGYFENVLISRVGARSAAWGSVLSCSWGLCWRSWAALGPLQAVLGGSWGRCVRSWAALGAYVGGLGPLLAPMLAVLGCSWGLSCRPWAALAAEEVGLGPKRSVLGRVRAEKWPKPKREHRKGHVA